MVQWYWSHWNLTEQLIVTFSWSPFFISVRHSFRRAIMSATPIASSEDNSIVGPCCHNSSFSSSLEGETPLEGMSAGFSDPWQCLQLAAGTNSLISSTLFCTNCFHSLSAPKIQQSAAGVTYRVSKVDLMFQGTSCCVWLTVIADRSSNLGMVSFLTGATLVFEQRNLAKMPLRLDLKVDNCSIGTLGSITELLQWVRLDWSKCSPPSQ